jgi:hypothetical protein
MMTDGLEQKLPIDAIEEALDVEIEHPVVTPAALASLAHGLDRRFAGPVAVGVGVERRLQDRLQVASDNLLSDAIGNRRNTQRSRSAIRLWNIDPPHRRRKVAP